MTPQQENSGRRSEGFRWSTSSRAGKTRAAASVITLLVAALGISLACRAEEPPDEPKVVTGQEAPTEPTVIDLDEGDSRPPPRVKAKHVKRGAEVDFVSGPNTVWVVIPSRYFSKVSGGKDWAIGDEMIAFKIDHGVARVKLAADFPASDEDQVIHYSILSFDGQTFYYQDGNSPPRMIIPPVP